MTRQTVFDDSDDSEDEGDYQTSYSRRARGHLRRVDRVIGPRRIDYRENVSEATASLQMSNIRPTSGLTLTDPRSSPTLLSNPNPSIPLRQSSQSPTEELADRFQLFRQHSPPTSHSNRSSPRQAEVQSPTPRSYTTGTSSGEAPELSSQQPALWTNTYQQPEEPQPNVYTTPSSFPTDYQSPCRGLSPILECSSSFESSDTRLSLHASPRRLDEPLLTTQAGPRAPGLVHSSIIHMEQQVTILEASEMAESSRAPVLRSKST